MQCVVRGIFRFALDPDICTVHRSVTGLDLDMSTVCSAWCTSPCQFHGA